MTELSKKEIEEIRREVDYVNWSDICWDYQLSEGFIREFADKLNWYYISCYQDLSEDFIREFADMVCWDNISYKQTLSDEFIIEFYDKLNWHELLLHKKINKNIFEKLNKGAKLYLLMNWRKIYDQIK